MDSNTNDSQNFSALWEQLRERFTRNRQERYGADSKRQRSIAITMCVLLSVFLWFIFSMQERYTISLTFPTEIVNVPPDEALADLPPSSVDVQVQAQGFTLLQLRYDPPTVPVNAAAQQVNFFEAVPQLPGGAQLENVFPRLLDLQREPRITLRVPVRLQAEIDTPPTHDLIEPPSVEPDSVLITGAQSIVEGVRFWPTVTVAEQGLRDSLVMRVPLADTLEGLVRVSEQAVTLTAVSRQFTEGTRMIDVIVTGVPSTDEMQVVTLERNEVRVRYRVLFSQYEDALEAPDFFATVSYEAIRSDTTGRVQPVPQLPDGMILRDVDLIPSSLQYYNRLPG